MHDLTKQAAATAATTVRLGTAAGFIACTAYPLMVAAPLPMRAAAALAACFGPALAVSGMGLKAMLDAERPTASSAVGLLMNSLAGALFSAMALVQIAIGELVKDPLVFHSLNGIWLGMNKAFDAYIGLGTIFFSVSMWRHPSFGRVYAIAGLVIGSGFILLNFYPFPSPPANAGLVDPGPAIDIWYLAVTINMARWLRVAAIPASGPRQP